jgi:hypothetical protein
MIRLIILFLFLSSSICAQTIRGYILDSLGKKLDGASIYLLSNGTIQKTVYSNDLGEYNIELKDSLPHSYQIIVSLWGYKTLKKNITIIEKINILNLTLQIEATQIEAIEVKAQDYYIKKIGDTTIYKIQQFSDSTEQNVEELLKKVPGVKVDENGRISFKGKSIEKVFIEGDDLFGNNYTIGTRNLSGKAIEEAQFIDKFSENPLLKGLENSDKLILNLTLKKVKFFGDMGLGLGYKNRYDMQGNLFFLSKKNKIINLFKHLNTGQDIIGDTQEGSQIFPPPNYTANISIIYPNLFNKQRFNENSPLLGTSFFIYKPNDKTKIQIGLGYYTDKQRQVYKDENLFKLFDENISITNQQNYDLSKRNLGINFLYSQKINIRSALNALFTLSTNKTPVYKDVIFISNGLSDTIRETIKPENTFWSSSLDYTYKISDKTAYFLILNAENSVNKETTNYINTIPRYLSLDSTLSANILRQYLQGENLNFNKKSFLYYKISPRNSLQSSLVLFSNKTKLFNEGILSNNTESRILQNPLAILTHQEIQGSVLYNRQGKINIQAQLKAYSSIIKIDTIQNKFLQSRNLISPSIVLEAKLKDKKIIGLNYKYGFLDTQLDNFYPIRRFRNYNLADIGTTRIDWIPKHNLNIKYSYISLYNQLFFNVLLDYQYTSKGYSSVININPLFSLEEKRLLGQTQSLLFSTSVDSYLDILKGKVEASLSTSIREYPNILVDKERINSFIFFKNDVSYSSKFNKRVNFKINCSQYWNQIISSFSNNTQRINNIIYKVRKEIYAKMNKNISLNFTTDYFYNNNNHIFMNDISLKTKIGRKRHLLEITCNNINFQSQVKLTTISDYQVYTQYFNFLPTFFLIKTNVNF